VDITLIAYDKTSTTAETIGNDHKKMHINSRYMSKVEQQIEIRNLKFSGPCIIIHFK
jgi:hypothetical protein